MYSSPQTPSSSHSSDRWLSYQPHLSSPLADVQVRRRSQYKSCTRRAKSSSSTIATPLPGLGPGLTQRSLSAETPQKAFLRERFQANCLERAERKRERVSRRRAASMSGSEGSSDGMDDMMDCEEEEDDDRIMQDELFKRIVDNAKRRKKHAYRLSYSYEVGSSFDPDMEDVSQWETELHEPKALDTSPWEVTPHELENEELAAYAEEYDALADFDDIDALADEMFNTNEWEDAEYPGRRMEGTDNARANEDVTMS